MIIFTGLDPSLFPDQTQSVLVQPEQLIGVDPFLLYKGGGFE
jgi:hypothetical protein